MQSDRNTFKFYVVIIKLYVAVITELWASNGLWNQWSRYVLCYYFQNMSKRVVHLLLAHEKWQFLNTVPIWLHHDEFPGPSLCLIFINYSYLTGMFTWNSWFISFCKQTTNHKVHKSINCHKRHPSVWSVVYTTTRAQQGVIVGPARRQCSYGGWEIQFLGVLPRIKLS